MNFLNIFEDRVAGIFGAAQAPFSFKKLAKQAAREMEDQTLVINGVDTAPALYTVLISADDDPLLAPYYAQLAREVSEFVKAQAEKKRYRFSGSPLVRFMIDPSLKAGKFSVFAENVDAPTLARLYEEERAFLNGGKQGGANAFGSRTPAPSPVSQPALSPLAADAEMGASAAAGIAGQPDPFAADSPVPDPLAAPIPVPKTMTREQIAGLGGAAAATGAAGVAAAAAGAHMAPSRPSAPARPLAQARGRGDRRHVRDHERPSHRGPRALRCRCGPARSQRQPQPRPARLHRKRLVHRGPWLHQWHARQQPPYLALPAAHRRPADLWPQHLRV